ncbi:hypothetical protein GCM10027289_24630 [Tsukamurella serpentis]
MFDGGRAGGQVDHRADPVELVQFPFDPAHAGRAGHPAHFEERALGGVRLRRRGRRRGLVGGLVSLVSLVEVRHPSSIHPTRRDPKTAKTRNPHYEAARRGEKG